MVSDLDNPTANTQRQPDGNRSSRDSRAHATPTPPSQAAAAGAPESLSSSIEPVLKVCRLSRHFGRLKAVDDISFQALPGQVMGFIGPNGAGKTTAMRMLATLDLPTSGDAFVCGFSVIDDPDQVRHRLGFMPDSFGKYVNLTVVEYLDFFSRAYGHRGDQRRDAVERVLVFTELRKIANKKITTLSKGMSQRLGLGRTLIHDPQILILDEPAAGLDPRARVELRELIRLLSTQLKKTVLISSHILTELGEICDSTVIIEAGKILAAGTVGDLQASSRKVVAQDRLLSIRLLGHADQAERWLVQHPLVDSALVTSGTILVQFTGTPEQRVELLREMIQQGFPVVEFGGKIETLEDIFMSITQGIVQ